jgi:hypothetical protein
MGEQQFSPTGRTVENVFHHDQHKAATEDLADLVSTYWTHLKQNQLPEDVAAGLLADFQRMYMEYLLFSSVEYIDPKEFLGDMTSDPF